jgi:hypothetical protein
VRAAHGLAVHGEHLALLRRRDTVRRGCLGELGQGPGAHRGLDCGRVEVLQDPADSAGVWHDRADPEPVQDGAAGVVGVLADCGERPRPGQYRARPQQQDRRHTVTDTAGLAWVGDLAERVN